MSNIQADGQVLEEDEEEATKEGATKRDRVDEVVVEVQGPEIDIAENPKEAATIRKVKT